MLSTKGLILPPEWKGLLQHMVGISHFAFYEHLLMEQETSACYPHLHVFVLSGLNFPWEHCP